MTGFEAYCKKRFIELENEGKMVNIDKLFSTCNIDNEEAETIRTEARAEGITPLKKLIKKGKINFQSYERCKKAYNKGYNIVFGNTLNVSNILLEQIKTNIIYRHKIVHISPLNHIVDHNTVPPVFANKDYARRAISAFETFIDSLNKATLKLP
ncbi:hypothetical protein [Candidatus Magnetominusculus xianensis]|uniref:hypothetical protein n=1 Tax=Candidatus Magnetominusculus xianensis TaxID=1748249 RepID=UPI0012EEC844|nr:hypothetical protein [Candidatus Magnetominusculus xianensis]MBF0403203.1 hypothetical protein [Nitrospirota bacterium]